jgi:hypothetical protein
LAGAGFETRATKWALISDSFPATVAN